MYSDKSFRLAEGNAASTFVSGNVRILFLTERFARFEWQENGRFEDRQTLAVVNRRLAPVKFSHEVHGSRQIIKTDAMTIELTDDRNRLSAETLSVSFTMNGKKTTWRPGQSAEGNLGSTIRTLDCIQGSTKMSSVRVDSLPHDRKIHRPVPVDLGHGFISRDGWSLIDDSRNIVIDQLDGHKWVTPRPQGERQDWYFLAYGHKYTDALADAAQVFGSQPLPPRYTLGYWWSRYWAYSDTEIEGLVNSFDRMGLPIDVMVIDMDWHLEGWTGYTWDRRFFPDPNEHLNWLHKKGVKVTLNLHPADGVAKFEEQFPAMCEAMGLDPAKTDRVPFDITDPKYMDNYFKILHHPDEKRGVDFWWMDWQQGESTAMPGLDTLPWINQLHWEDMENRPDRHHKRPLIFSRFGGYGSGRYNIGFSGDTFSTWQSLAFQPYFTATAANVLYGYWSHDIGGHMPGAIEPELYTRWIQYGIYSPILRTHTTKNPEAERRVWEYPAPYSDIMMETIRQRYSMVPYIYSENRKAMDSAVSLCRPMYYRWPENDEAYLYRDQYMFGDHMLVAPIITRCNPDNEMAETSIWLPEGEWFDTARGTMEKGGGVITRKYMIGEVPVFVRPGTIIPGQKYVSRLNQKCYRNLRLHLYPGNDGTYRLYEDDGISTDYLNSKFAIIGLNQTTSGNIKTIRVARERGEFNGYEAERGLEIRLEGSVPPAAVKVNGKALTYAYRLEELAEGWSYQGLQAAAVIKIDRFNLDSGIEITVEFADGTDHRLADGLPGCFRRLERANALNTMLTTGAILHPRERLSQELFHTANRISRHPETFATEIAGLKEKLPQLPQVIDELAGSTFDHNFNDAMHKRMKLGQLAGNIIKDITLGI